MPRLHPVDVHVGVRLRQRRNLVGLSQTKLSESVGLTFQQIQKYENGTNRISSSRLYEFAKVLNVPVSYFFDEMPSKALGRPVSGRGREGFRGRRLAVQGGEGSADQTRDAGASASLQQDRRGASARFHICDGQGSGGVRSRQAFGGPPQTLAYMSGMAQLLSPALQAKS